MGGATVRAVSHMSSITLPLLGTMAPWRITFLIAAAPGIPFALLVFTLREPLRRGVLQARGQSSLSARETLRQVGVRWSSVAGICGGMICQAICNYGFMAWVPTFFARTYHWAPGQTGRALGLIIATFGCLGMYVGGRVSDRWLKKGIHDAPLRTGVPSAIGTAVLFPLAFLIAPNTCSVDGRADLPGSILSGTADGHGGGGAADDFPQSGARTGIGFLFVLSEPGWVEHRAAHAGRARRPCISQ